MEPHSEQNEMNQSKIAQINKSEIHSNLNTSAQKIKPKSMEDSLKIKEVCNVGMNRSMKKLD